MLNWQDVLVDGSEYHEDTLGNKFRKHVAKQECLDAGRCLWRTFPDCVLYPLGTGWCAERKPVEKQSRREKNLAKRRGSR